MLVTGNPGVPVPAAAAAAAQKLMRTDRLEVGLTFTRAVICCVFQIGSTLLVKANNAGFTWADHAVSL